ncbi:MAG: efflux RND transporter periplasmic adaptor subunit [Gammaproteobacteria bacterium]|nr:efflux RND transporter periplasmic adaptor subunit [Gammaproteobacteria bacterium]
MNSFLPQTRATHAPRLLLAAALLMLGACTGPGDGASAPAGAGGQASRGTAGAQRPGAGAGAAVLTARVEPRDFIDQTTALGTARATASIEVTSRISSTVTAIRFNEGQDVAAGALLVQLDSREIAAALALAEASLQQSRSQYERSLPLAKTGVLSTSQIEELEAKMKMDRAQVQSARARLDDTMIRAPFAGTVGLRRISMGDLVGPSSVLTTLDDTREIRLEFSVPEVFLGELAPGMNIRAQSTVYPGRAFTGTVSTIDSRVDPLTRAITVVAIIPNADKLLKPGMFLTVALERARQGVLMVPEEALNPRQGKQFVFLVREGRAVEQEVEIGARSPGLVEIRSGLAPGDVVVTDGIQRLRDGAPVDVLQDG